MWGALVHMGACVFGAARDVGYPRSGMTGGRELLGIYQSLAQTALDYFLAALCLHLCLQSSGSELSCVACPSTYTWVAAAQIQQRLCHLGLHPTVNTLTLMAPFPKAFPGGLFNRTVYC